MPDNFSNLFQTQSQAKTGISEIMEQATKMGFTANNPDWANLGQGSPETGQIEGDLDRIQNISVKEFADYPPNSGTKELRQKIADFYNQIYRQNQTQKYSYQNVCILNGGRGAVVKALAVLNKIRFGYLLPDYASYEGAFSLFRDLDLEGILLDEKDSFKLDLKNIISAIQEKSLKGLLMSNPSNPTGQMMNKNDLKEFLTFLKNKEFCLIHDEFYSRYIYNQESQTQTISASEFIEDTEKENVIIIDGLTKSWRYPGWRLSWILAPQKVVEEISIVSSFMDGGAAFPLQNAALELFDTQNFAKNTQAMQKTFNQKREFLIKSLKEIGLKIKSEPMGAFYVFVDISNLKKGLNTDLEFVQKALEKKLIVVSGSSFDINPFNKRKTVNFGNYIRLSYGPEMAVIQRGVEKLKDLILN